jgi:hypothetical protein
VDAAVARGVRWNTDVPRTPSLETPLQAAGNLPYTAIEVALYAVARRLHVMTSVAPVPFQSPAGRANSALERTPA